MTACIHFGLSCSFHGAAEPSGHFVSSSTSVTISMPDASVKCYRIDDFTGCGGMRCPLVVKARRPSMREEGREVVAGQAVRLDVRHRCQIHGQLVLSRAIEQHVYDRLLGKKHVRSLHPARQGREGGATRHEYDGPGRIDRPPCHQPPLIDIGHLGTGHPGRGLTAEIVHDSSDARCVDAGPRDKQQVTAEGKCCRPCQPFGRRPLPGVSRSDLSRTALHTSSSASV
jgi:hypothetical protein